MEKKRFIHLYRQGMPCLYLLCALLMLTACGGDDDNGSDPLPPTRTPLTISGPLTVSATPSITITRADAQPVTDFFKPEDKLEVIVEPKDGRGDLSFYTFIYTTAGTWEQPAGDTPIYYEDVHNGAPTHDFTAIFGYISANQRTPEAHHQSDQVSGTLILTDERTLVAENPFERLATLLVVRLSRPTGDGWTDARFREYMKSDIAINIYTTDGQGYTPLAGWNADLGVMEYRAIVPVVNMAPKIGWEVFEIIFNKPGLSGVTHTLKADATDIFKNPAGKMYTLNATYNPRGTFDGNLTFDIAPWKDAIIPTPAPAQTEAQREKERFIRWYTNNGRGGRF